jgi:hypothetical protein
MQCYPVANLLRLGRQELQLALARSRGVWQSGTPNTRLTDALIAVSLHPAAFA